MGRGRKPGPVAMSIMRSQAFRARQLERFVRHGPSACAPHPGASSRRAFSSRVQPTAAHGPAVTWGRSSCHDTCGRASRSSNLRDSPLAFPLTRIPVLCPCTPPSSAHWTVSLGCVPAHRTARPQTRRMVEISKLYERGIAAAPMRADRPKCPSHASSCRLPGSRSRIALQCISASVARDI